MNISNLSTKTKAIAITTISLIVYAACIASEPTLARAYEFTTDLFTDPVTYSAPISDYDKRTQALFSSKSFQASCLAGARARVALEIAKEKKDEANHYLNESDTNTALSLGIFESSPVSVMGASSTKSSKTK